MRCCVSWSLWVRWNRYNLPISMVFGKFTKWCNYHYKSVLEYFISANKISRAHLLLLPVSNPCPRQPLIYVCLYRFASPGISHGQITCSLVSDSFTELKGFEIHPCHGISKSFLFIDDLFSNVDRCNFSLPYLLFCTAVPDVEIRLIKISIS